MTSPVVAPTSTVTKPFESTVAINSSLEDQVTLVSVAFVTVAVSCCVSPAATVAVVGSTVTVTGSLGCCRK